jgi:hypothetical protein
MEMFASPGENGVRNVSGYIHNYSGTHGVLVIAGQVRGTEAEALEAGVAFAKKELEKVQK